MKLFTKNNGAVSVFLVIILVPMLVVTSLFVDVGRMHLGQAMMDSAGDLALNTAMTEFDVKLNDFYGLLGTCKSEEELKTVCKKFYEQSLISAGLAEGDADNLVSQLMSMFGEDVGDISDLMNLEVVNDSFSFKTIDNSGFNNPAVVKTQVINFMKYRSPINGVLNLLESVKKLSTQSGNIQEETELIEEKQDMCEKQKSLMEVLKELNEDINTYESCAANGMVVSNASGMKSIIQSTNQFCQTFYDYSEEAAINFLYLDINKARSFDPKNNKVKIATKNNRNTTLTSSFIDMDNLILLYRQKRDALRDACEINTNNPLRDGLVKAIKVPELYSDYVKTAKAFSQTYQNMIAAYPSISTPEDTYPNTFESLENKSLTYKETYEWFKAIYENCERDFNGKNKSSYYHRILEDKVDGVGKKQISELKQQYNTEKTKVDNKLTDLANQYNAIDTAITNAIDSLNESQKKLRKIVKNDGLLEQYNTSNQVWRSHANSLKNKGSQIGEEDVKMYSGPEKDSDGNLLDAGLQKGIKENVTQQNVNKLRNQIISIKDNLASISFKLGKMKFGADHIGKMNSVDKVNTKFASKISRESFESNLSDIQKLKELVKSAFDSLYKDNSENISDAWVGQADSKPSLRDDPLRRWLDQVFGADNRKTDKKDDYKNKYQEKSKNEAKKTPEETEVAAEQLGEKYKVSSNGIKALDGSIKLPSSEIPLEVNPIATRDDKQSDDLKQSSNVIGTMFSGIASAVASMATGFRDDLYAVDYITSMLSYDTYVNEGLYDIAKAKNYPVDKLSSTRNSIKRSDVISEWKNESYTNTANKSLTNKEISRENNYAFGNEAEYILYGSNNSAKNKACAYATIFSIRLGLNSVYAFKEYWKDYTITSLATAISAATYGVIPPALIKVAIILALAVSETVHDIAMLKAGMPVAVLKKNDTWVMTVSKVFGGDASLNGVTGSGEDHGNFDLSLRYSDYIKLFLMISMVAGNEDKVYARLADVIQCNMAHVTNNKAYSLSKCKTWFSVSSKVMVKPLMLDLPWTRDVEGNPKDNTNWYTLSYKRANGYY